MVGFIMEYEQKKQVNQLNIPMLNLASQDLPA